MTIQEFMTKHSIEIETESDGNTYLSIRLESSHPTLGEKDPSNERVKHAIEVCYRDLLELITASIQDLKEIKP